MVTIRYLFSIAIIAFFVNAEFAATPLDFDGDGKSDPTIIRNVFDKSLPAIFLHWYTRRSSDGGLNFQVWGRDFSPINTLDDPLPADFDGDGKTDVAIWRLATNGAEYHILRSSTLTHLSIPFGLQNDRFDAIGDYDGDGKADPAIYRIGATSNEPNVFIYRPSLNNPNSNFHYFNWGVGSMSPLPGDFDGDGKTDFCVQVSNGPDAGLIILRRSFDGGVEYIRWGLVSDTISVGDFDGDGKDDLAARRTVGGAFEWYILERDGGGTGAGPILWGRQDLNDVPVNGLDFDGDGRTDIAVYRRNATGNSVFYVRRSSDGTMLAIPWGIFDYGDTPPVRYQR